MTRTPFPQHEDLNFSSQLDWDAFDDRQLVDAHMIDASQTPPATYNAPRARTMPRVSCKSPVAHTQTQAKPDKLQFLQLDEWNEHNSYEEEVPTCIYYSIEWKVAVNSKELSKDTERDLVLAPTAYWHMVLKPKLERLLRKKLPQNRHVRGDDTNVIVSVNHRSERDLIKRFEEIDVDWSIVEKQLIAWSDLFRSGKTLRVDLTFNYVDSQPLPASTPRRGNKRGSSATQKMLADRATQLDAEQEITGNPSVWREIYALMRCPGPPCNLGPHCWRDPFGKRHYKLRTHHLKALINFVEEGHTLKSHDDVPEDIREQLFAAENQRLDRQPQLTNMSTPNFPPINITNVLPQSHQSPASFIEATPAAVVRPLSSTCLDIPGPRDLAVKAYSEWQQSNVADEQLKAVSESLRGHTARWFGLGASV